MKKHAIESKNNCFQYLYIIYFCQIENHSLDFFCICLGKHDFFKKNKFFSVVFLLPWKFVASLLQTFSQTSRGGLQVWLKLSMQTSRAGLQLSMKVCIESFNVTLQVSLNFQSSLESLHWKLQSSLESLHWKFQSNLQPHWKFDWKFATNFQQTFRAAKNLKKKLIFLKAHVVPKHNVFCVPKR